MSDERLISDYLCGEASEPERLELEYRMQRDLALHERVERLAALTERLADLPPAAWRSIEDPAAWRSIEEPERTAARRRRRVLGVAPAPASRSRYSPSPRHSPPVSARVR